MGRAILTLLLLAVAGCRADSVPARRPNVLLIVIDTLRADRLGAYGNPHGLTPFLDELAASGHLVRRARAQAPWTNPSVASILTSRFQSQHGIVDYRSALAASELTLAEVLQADGYVTAAFSANGLIGASLGFAQGFDHFEAHLLMKGADPTYLRIPRRADQMAADAFAWLDGVRRDGHPDAPIFLYLQLMEPHAPYAPSPEALERVRGTNPPIDLRRASETMYIDTLAPVGEAQLQEVVDAYDASVVSVDTALRGFFAALRERGFLDHAVVVVTADHGEEFQDHGLRGHGKTLYDEVIHVPLIVLAPGPPHAGIVEHLVSSVDIAPTVLALAGVPVPPSFEGTSFAADLDSSLWARARRALARMFDDRPAPVAYSEHLRPAGEAPTALTPQERALVLDDTKLIGWRDGERRFYALDLDPGEQDPNIVEEPDRVRLEQRLVETQARAARNPAQAEIKMPDPQVREALKALGYAE
jgi:arylsulfatase A-like enzyme